MNLHQALVAQRHAELTAEQARLQGVREGVERIKGYKVHQFFHDCVPECRDKQSRSPDDHVPQFGRQRPTCRVLYPKHLAFMASTARHRESLLLGGNRSGKTEAAAYSLRCWLTGEYPEWWQGRRFDGPIKAWAAGDTRQTTRDILQVALMGPYQDVEARKWSGMIDPHRIKDVSRASGGISDCLDTVYVQHASGKMSELQFRSYDQGRRAFQGTSRHVILLDEEPPDGAVAQEAQAEGSTDLWTECVMRTLDCDGIVVATFTPLRGMTPLLKQYIETAVMADLESDAEVAAKAHFYPDVLREALSA